jgi:hypothetical protein
LLKRQKQPQQAYGKPNPTTTTTITMKFLSAISLLLLASSYTTAIKHSNIRSKIAMLDDAEQQETQQEAPERPHRRGKKTSSSSDDSPDDNDNPDDRDGGSDGDVIFDPGLINESRNCIPFTDPQVAVSIDKGQTTEGHDSECDTNSCGSSGSPGCCRFHTSLLRCDENDDYPHQAVRTNE